MPEFLFNRARSLSPEFNPQSEGLETGSLQATVDAGGVVPPFTELGGPTNASQLELAAFAPATLQAMANIRATIPNVSQQEVEARFQLYGDDFISPEEITQIATEAGVLPEDVVAAAREIGLLNASGQASTAGDKVRSGGSSTEQVAREGQFQTVGLGI